MKWNVLVMGMLVAGGTVVDAGAVSLGNFPQASVEEPPAVATPAAAPRVRSGFILPPHLTGALPLPPGWTPDQRGMPTLQDFVVISPVYVAPPPTRHRVRQHGGRRR